MPASAVLTIHAVPHPEPSVRRAGFTLDHPYVEQVCASVIGPTPVLLLRRLSVLWHESEPAVVQASELSRSLGLGANTQHRDCRFWRTVDRLVKFGFASCPTEDVVEAYVTVKPLTPRQVERLPEWSRHAHDRLLGEHLDQLAAASAKAGRLAPQPTHHMTARLDRLEQLPSVKSLGLG